MGNTITPGATYTGIITITSSGVAVSGPNVKSLEGFILKGHPSNTGIVWIFDDGASQSTGFPLSASEIIIIDALNLNLLDFGSDTASQKICYIKL